MLFLPLLLAQVAPVAAQVASYTVVNIVAILTPLFVFLLGALQLYINKKQGSKLEDIHTFVNSEYGVSLKIGAAALQRVADITKLPADIQHAADAVKLSDEHAAAQLALNAADAKTPVPVEAPPTAVQGSIIVVDGVTYYSKPTPVAPTPSKIAGA